METKARSEAVVAVPFEELWSYMHRSLETVEQSLQKARQSDSRWLRWMTRRLKMTIEHMDRPRQEIQLALTIRFLSRMVIPFGVSLNGADAQTTQVVCRTEIIFPRGLRGRLLRRLYDLAMRNMNGEMDHRKITTLQEWLDALMQAWVEVVERAYQRFGNLAPQSLSETEQDIRNEHQAEQKRHLRS